MHTFNRSKTRITVTFEGQCFDDLPRSAVKAGAVPLDDAPLRQEITALGFQIADEFFLEPSPHNQLQMLAGAGSSVAGTAFIEAELGEDEHAVILTDDDGLLRWHIPAQDPGNIQRAGVSAAPGTNRVRFVIPMASPSMETGRASGLLGFAWKAVKTFVLKWVAKKVIDFAVDKLESGIETGPVILSVQGSTDCVRDPDTWKPKMEKPRIDLPGNRTPRVLLFIHGTFSSTLGSFGALAAMAQADSAAGDGSGFIAAACNQYDLILGFDHKTISESPSENAGQILRFLKQIRWPRPPMIDTVCFSRGGLVFRSLIEQKIHKEKFDASFRKAIFVGCTNAGTLLANPDNWNTLIDLYTNIAAGATAAIGAVTGGAWSIAARQILKGVSILLKHIVAYAATSRSAPGIEAMNPSSSFITAINKAETPIASYKDLEYYFVTGDFEPRTASGGLRERFKLWLADGLVDRLMQRAPNDLVVNTGSMTNIDPDRENIRVLGSLPYMKTDGVFHTVYFAQKRTALFLGASLGIPGFDMAASHAFMLIQDNRKTPNYTSNVNVLPDRVDLRDWPYQPHLRPLPDELVNLDLVPEILDQGREGACTGFALSAVINYLLSNRSLRRRTSPFMLYEMARKYDEWPGEEYEGSSARGAMKGWLAHGVCERNHWPVSGMYQLTPDIAKNAMRTPGGAYYRVDHRNIRDMHAALLETGILFATLMVHEGWNDPQMMTTLTYFSNGNKLTRDIRVIARVGRATGGHAVAIVGYTKNGFIIQNSWGESWGSGGFALLPYEDYLLHAMDVWVAQLGVPIEDNVWNDVVELSSDRASTIAGLFRAGKGIPLEEIRPYIIDVENNGRLSRSGKYWTTEADLQQLFFKTIANRVYGSEAKSWKKPRLMLFLHGGLNSEEDAAKRVVAIRDVCLANEIYPLHIMWETSAKETLIHLIEDIFSQEDKRAGSFREWFDKYRAHLRDAKNRAIEISLAKPGQAFWNEMKENARLASLSPDGAIQIASRYVSESLKLAGALKADQWEIHVVAHSAGSIFSAYAIPTILSLGLPLKTVQFLAPAISMDEFAGTLMPLIYGGRCPLPSMYILDDETEKRDTVSRLYGHSLLYLVSNAFESRREMPILGMQKFLDPGMYEPQEPEIRAIQNVYRSNPKQLIVSNSRNDGRSSSRTHGGFDNDLSTMNSVLRVILGLKQNQDPPIMFTAQMLDY